MSLRSTLLSEETALAEGEHLVASQPVPPKRGRHVHHGTLALERVLDLRDPGTLRELGIDSTTLPARDHTACQRVGGTAAWLGAQAIIVPSARAAGANLVIFYQNVPADFEVTFAESHPVDDD